tara:strand:+ start:4076 stop:4780 length:705 start_codon:yes stop_codon:yes gene_type:complete
MAKQIKKIIQCQKGFSLMEISVVLIVMGVLIGGTIKGYALVENAQLKTVIKNINQYRMAVNIFKDQYGSLPGDYSDASTTIRSDLIDGNGNGQIEGDGIGRKDSEAVNFWQHLAAANLITSVGALPKNNDADFGKGIPKEKIGGGITVVQDPDGPASMSGLWFVLGRKKGGLGTGSVLSPKQAQALLNQVQDADPLSGDVRVGPGIDTAYDDCLKDGKLNKEIEYPACIVYFKV